MIQATHTAAEGAALRRGLGFRVSAFFSSLVTGTMVGALTGAVAWAITRLRCT